MFRGLINDAKSAVGNLVLKYVARASVAVPFVIAVGFAVAAIASMLVERFGAVTGYWIVAGGMDRRWHHCCVRRVSERAQGALPEDLKEKG
jgi:hypothetical protein